MPSVSKCKHPKICAVLRSKHEKVGPLSLQDCKELIGWSEETEKNSFTDFVLKDRYGKKIRLLNNPSNRPFKKALAERYANEHLRKKWFLNGETIIIDCNGSVLQGQHRLVGFILGEQERQINPMKWGKLPLVFEVLLGFGFSPKPENANTYDLGAKRSFGDVIYRHEKFSKEITDKDQRKISKVLAGAVRLVWLRVGGQQVSFAPHFPHSEALEFYKKHPGILEATTTIIQLDDGEEGNERNISSLLSPNYAAALYYLMIASTDVEKATEFWSAFASGEGLKKGSPILLLRQLLVKTDSGGSRRDEIIGAVVKAWLLWKENKEAVYKDIKVARKKDGDRIVLAEFPRIGGIDSPVEVKVELSQHQLLILSVLKTRKKEITYKELRGETGLQVGTLSNEIMDENKQGNTNPHSLISRKLVEGNQYEPANGEKIAPYYFQLSKTGQKFVS